MKPASIKLQRKERVFSVNMDFLPPLVHYNRFRILCLLVFYSSIVTAQTFTVSGTILEPQGTIVAGARVNIQIDSVASSTITDTNGVYSFQVPALSDIQIIPELNADCNCAVSETDTAAIISYINGIVPFTTPYPIHRRYLFLFFSFRR